MDALSNYDWIPLCEETSVDAAADSLNAAVTEAMVISIPFELNRKK
jgi:hypothetical protein